MFICSCRYIFFKVYHDITHWTKWYHIYIDSIVYKKFTELYAKLRKSAEEEEKTEEKEWKSWEKIMSSYLSEEKFK